MNKKIKILSKVLSCALLVSVLQTSLPNQFANAASITDNAQENQYYKSSSKEKVLSEDSTYKVTEANNVRTVLNKETKQTTTLTFTDSKHSKGKFKDVNGEIKNFETDAKGNVYLDGTCIIETTTTLVSSESSNASKSLTIAGYYNSDYFTGSDGRTYYYVSTRTYNTKTAGEANSIAMSILSFLPYAGPTIGLVGIIQSFQSLGEPIMYIKEKMYCTSSYQFYAYKNYFYSDSNYTDLVRTSTVYKQMW